MSHMHGNGMCTCGYFQGTKFSRIALTKHLADYIFEDRGLNDHTPTAERFQY